MFPKALAIVFSLLVTASYVIGFIYDASFLEEFGVNYYEMIGSPLDYLSIGGMYLLFSYSQNLSYLVFGLGIIGICYVPCKRKLSRRSIEKYVDTESVPYVIFSLIPLMLLFFLPIVTDSKTAADEVKAKQDDAICLEGQQQCLRGSVLRYRESKVIFFESESKETRVFPDRVVLSVKQG
ncbi:hypothetical protein [Marinobacter sp. F3R08]|uniref:hypothetical protein n=1 Tax=Marinobacter sp. F3R08 TaxID=2841559 RepID=UPI001C08302B|nr:hypothetical protein [Marinobacter sp. F3R08]MBU2954594.1 hypothetical protein [Marinobacter sp. F3R08]